MVLLTRAPPAGCSRVLARIGAHRRSLKQGPRDGFKVSLAARAARLTVRSAARESGGIGRRTGFRCPRATAHRGSSPRSRTIASSCPRKIALHQRADPRRHGTNTLPPCLSRTRAGVTRHRLAPARNAAAGGSRRTSQAALSLTAKRSLIQNSHACPGVSYSQSLAPVGSPGPDCHFCVVAGHLHGAGPGRS